MDHRQSSSPSHTQHTHTPQNDTAVESTEKELAPGPLLVQSGIGNAAMRRALDETRAQRRADSLIVGALPIIGNAAMQRLLQRSGTGGRGTAIQRRLGFMPTDLKGQTAAGGLRSHALSAFKGGNTYDEIKNALSEYHQTSPDNIVKLEKLLDIIITRCNAWLNNPSHQQGVEQTLRDSLTTLRTEAWVEYKRVLIMKEIGVPQPTAEKFDTSAVENFYGVVKALHQRDVKTAFDLFDQYKGVLGDGAALIEGFMKRNQIHLIDPQMAAVMNDPKFELKSKTGSQDAINLIKAQAQAKLDRLEVLKKEHAAALTAYLAAKGKKQVTPDDLPPDKRAIFDEAAAKSAKIDPLMLLDYPILIGTTPEGIEFGKLQLEKAQYENIVSGKAVQDKKQEKGFGKFTDVELYGLMGYTSNLYGAINSPLRFDVGTTKFSAGHASLAGSITSALHKLPPFKGTVYRHGGDFPGFATVNIEGAVVSDMAPLSTAIDQKGPANAAEKHEVLEILTSITGRDVSKASVFGSKEGEVLFESGTRFRVLAAFERDKVQWGKNHDIGQWLSNGQRGHPLFNMAMAAVARDDKKNMFHRVIIKTEVT